MRRSCPSCPIGGGNSNPSPTFSAHANRKSRSSRSLVYRSDTCLGACPDQKCRSTSGHSVFCRRVMRNRRKMLKPPLTCSMALRVGCRLSLSVFDCSSWAPVEDRKSKPTVRLPTKSLSIFAREQHRSTSRSPLFVFSLTSRGAGGAPASRAGSGQRAFLGARVSSAPVQEFQAVVHSFACLGG